MEAFGHLSVLISIIVGLAITQLLQGLRGIVLARARTRIYWLPVAWAAIVLLICVQSWWAMFGLRNVREWTFLGFAVVLLQVVAIYLQAAFVLPDFSGSEPVDLRSHYYDHLGWFFGASILTLVASLAKDVVLSGTLPAAPNLAFHLLLISLSVAAIVTRREWFHRANASMASLAIVGYIVLLFTRLQ